MPLAVPAFFYQGSLKYAECQYGSCVTMEGFGMSPFGGFGNAAMASPWFVPKGDVVVPGSRSERRSRRYGEFLNNLINE